MANRFIKSSIWTSPNLNDLEDATELLFYRLLPLPDDYGCFDAHPKVLKGVLFPLKESWTPEIIGENLCKLVKHKIIFLWVCDNNRLYGYFHNWEKHQQCRSKFKRKTPSPPKCTKTVQKEQNIAVCKMLEDIVISCYQLLSVAISPHSSLPSSPSSLDSAIASSDKSANSTKPKTRSKAQRWNDGQIDLINKKFKDIWSCEPNIKDVTIWLKLADKSVGLVIVGLSSAKICEHETGKPTNNMTGYLRWFFRNRSDRDIDMATKIDRGYEINFKTKVGVVSIGDIMKGK